MPSDNTTVLGFDFGMKYIGVAVGQTITQSSQPLSSLRATAGIPDWAAIQSLLKEWNPSLLLVGVPLNMDGTEQPMTLQARHFAAALQRKTQLPIIEVDERLSTWEAKQRVSSQKKHKNPRSTAALNEINATAAAILVEQWLRDNV
jgi:putative pre-16S rRNA nuclease